MRNGTRPTIISDTKSGTLPEGPLFEIRDLSSEGRHSDGRYQMTGAGLRTSSFRGSEGKLKNRPALYSSVSIVRKDILRYASLKPDRLTYPCLRVPSPESPFPIPIPRSPADTGFHSFGLYEQRGGKAWRHSFISRKRAFHGNGDRRTEAITSESCRSRCTDNEIPHKTPEERPARHDGGKYGYTCSSLTTQIFRFGGCSWPIHRSRRPEPNRAAALG